MLLFVSVLIIADRSDRKKTAAKVNYNISEKQIYILVNPLDVLYYQPRWHFHRADKWADFRNPNHIHSHFCQNVHNHALNAFRRAAEWKQDWKMVIMSSCYYIQSHLVEASKLRFNFDRIHSPLHNKLLFCADTLIAFGCQQIFVVTAESVCHRGREGLSPCLCRRRCMEF